MVLVVVIKSSRGLTFVRHMHAEHDAVLQTEIEFYSHPIDLITHHKLDSERMRQSSPHLNRLNALFNIYIYIFQPLYYSDRVYSNCRKPSEMQNRRS